MGLYLQFIKFVADLKTIKRRRTKAKNLEYLHGLNCTIEIPGVDLRSSLKFQFKFLDQLCIIGGMSSFPSRHSSSTFSYFIKKTYILI